jgi:hypothetical protein
MLRQTNIRSVLLSLVVLWLSATPSMAGTTGVLSGFAFADETRVPIRGATIRVTTCIREWACTTVETTTNARGHFTFVSLSPGVYYAWAVVPRTSLVSECSNERISVDADTSTFLTLWVYDSSKIISDCFSPREIRPAAAASMYSFDADGDPER